MAVDRSGDRVPARVPDSRWAIGWAGRRRLETWFYVAALVPILLFFLLFGYPHEGGYFVGIAPFLAILGGHGLDRWKRPPLAWIAVPLLVCQAAIGVQRVRFSGYEHLGPARRARAEQTRELLPHGGVVVTLDFSLQTISGMYEGLREINMVTALEVSRTTLGPEQFAVHMRAMPEAFGMPLAFDLGYREVVELIPETIDYADSAFAALERLCAHRRVTIDGRTFLLIED